MKRIGIILLVFVFLTGCNDSVRKLSIDKTLNYLDQPITSFPYYGLEDAEDYVIHLANKKNPYTIDGTGSGGNYWLDITFEKDADSTGFLGIENHKVKKILVFFEYDNESRNDAKTKITEIYVYYAEPFDTEYLNKTLCKYFEDESNDYTQTKNTHSYYEYTYNHKEEKTVSFGVTEWSGYEVHFC